MFWQLVVSVPIVSLLFGSGQLASVLFWLPVQIPTHTKMTSQAMASVFNCQNPQRSTITATREHGGRIGWWGSTLTGDKTPEKNIAEVKGVSEEALRFS